MVWSPSPPPPHRAGGKWEAGTCGVWLSLWSGRQPTGNKRRVKAGAPIGDGRGWTETPMLPSPGLAPGESQRRVALFPLQLPAMDGCPVRQGGEGGGKQERSVEWHLLLLVAARTIKIDVCPAVCFVRHLVLSLLIQAHDEPTPKLDKQTIPPPPKQPPKPPSQ